MPDCIAHLVDATVLNFMIIGEWISRLLLLFLYLILTCLQCFDAVGWAAGRATGL